MYKLSPV